MGLKAIYTCPLKLSQELHGPDCWVVPTRQKNQIQQHRMETLCFSGLHHLMGFQDTLKLFPVQPFTLWGVLVICETLQSFALFYFCKRQNALFFQTKVNIHSLNKKTGLVKHMVKELIRLEGILQPFCSLQAKETNLTRLANFH